MSCICIHFLCTSLCLRTRPGLWGCILRHHVWSHQAPSRCPCLIYLGGPSPLPHLTPSVEHGRTQAGTRNKSNSSWSRTNQTHRPGAAIRCRLGNSSSALVLHESWSSWVGLWVLLFGGRIGSRRERNQPTMITLPNGLCTRPSWSKQFYLETSLRGPSALPAAAGGKLEQLLGRQIGLS